MLPRKEAFAVTQNPITFYNTYCRDDGYAIQWVTDAYYFCTRGKTASSNSTKYSTLGFKITAPDKSYANAKIGGDCIKQWGDSVQDDTYTYNLYKVEYTDMVNYMALYNGNSSRDIDLYNSFTRENNKPLFKFDAIMTVVLGDLPQGIMKEDINGICTYTGKIYRSLSEILAAANWSDATDVALKKYFEIPGDGANISVGTKTLIMNETMAPANGMYYNSTQKMYYAKYGTAFQIRQDAISSYVSESFQANMNWLNHIFFMLPQGLNKTTTNLYKQEETNTGGGITDDRVTLTGWTTSRTTYDKLTTYATVKPTTNNDVIKFQPRARIYNGNSYTSATTRANAIRILTDSCPNGTYDNAKSIIVTVDGNAPSGSFYPNLSSWTNQTITIRFTPTDSQAGVDHYARYNGMSLDGGVTWTWDTTAADHDFSAEKYNDSDLITEGLRRIKYSVYDNVGNASTVYSGVYKIDKTDPSGIFTPNSCTWTSIPTYNVQFNPSDDTYGSGVRNWTYQIRTSANKGSTWSVWSSTIPITGDITGSIPLTPSDNCNLYYQIQCVVTDNAGNSATVSSGTFQFDRKDPILSLTPNTDWQNSSGSTKITLTASDDASGISYVKFGGKSSALDAGSEVNLTDNGLYKNGATNVTSNGTYYFTVADRAGNKQVVSCIVSSFDTSAPSIVITPTLRSWAGTGGNSAVPVAIKVTDTLSGLKNIIIQTRSKTSEAGTWSDWSNIASITDLEIGSSDNVYTKNITLDTPGAASGQAVIWQIQVYATDDVNNSSSWVKSDGTIGYQIDKVMPFGNLSPNNSTWSNSSAYPVTFTPSDAHSGVKQWAYQIRSSSDNKTTWTSWSPVGATIVTGSSSTTLQFNPPAGAGTRYQIKYLITDNAGNTSSEITSGDYCFDRIAPSGIFTPNTCIWRNTNLSISFNPSDAGYSGVKQWRYRLSNNNGSSYGAWSNYVVGSTNITISTEGYNIIQAEVTDNANNISTIKSGQYLIDKTAPSAKYSKSRFDSTMMININDVIEALSGISNIYVDIYDKDNPKVYIRQILTQINETTSYEAEVTLTEALKTASSLAIYIYLVDKAGNVKVLSDETTLDFTVNATVKRVIEPNDPIFNPGQQGMILISLSGYVDKVSITFESIFNQSGIAQDAEYTLIPQEFAAVRHLFYVPPSCQQGKYVVEVTAYRKSESKTVYADFDVQTLKMNKIRTRIRSH